MSIVEPHHRTPTVDPEDLRGAVLRTYTEVATEPDGPFPFPTGRPLAEALGYPADVLATVPDEVVARFAGVDNPFAAAPIPAGSRVVDLGAGGGLDSVVAARIVGAGGYVVGVDLAPAMLVRARRATSSMRLANLDFRKGLVEDLPVDRRWADVVIGNGTLRLVLDKAAALAEAHRVLRPGGVLQLADVAVGREASAAAGPDLERWSDGIAGGLSVDGWCDLIAEAGFRDVAVGLPTDTYGGAIGEGRARASEAFGHTFRARKP